jgi:WD40 repeat protein
MKNILTLLIIILSLTANAQTLQWTGLANPDSLQVNGVSFSADNSKVLSGTNCHPAHLRLYQSTTGTMTWDYEVPSSLMCMMGVGFSSDGKYMAAIEEMGNLVIFDYTPATPDSINTITMGTTYAFCMAFSPNGYKIAVGGSNGKLQTYQVVNGQVDLNLVAHSSWVTAVCYAPNNLLLASGGNDNKVKLYDTTGNLMYTLNAHTDDITSIRFSPDSKFVYTASLDETIRIWDATNGDLIHTIQVGTKVNAIDLTPNGAVLAAAGQNGHILFYNSNTYTQISSFQQDHNTSALCLDFDITGQRLVTGTANGLVTMYNVSAITSTEEFNYSSDYAVYPNPFVDKINIPSETEPASIYITDLTGKRIPFTPHSRSIQLNTDLPQGMYFLNLNIKNRNHSFRVTKE